MPRDTVRAAQPRQYSVKMCQDSTAARVQSGHRTRRLVDRLAHIKRLRKTRAEGPADLIANLKAGVFNRAHHAVLRARAAKCEKMAAGFQHTKTLAPRFNIIRNASAVP